MDNVCNRCLFSIPSKVEMAEEQEYLRHKQHTADLQLVALFPSHLVIVQFFGSQTQAGWWCALLSTDP